MSRVVHQIGQSYLSDWSQYVSYNNAASKLATMKCGVPQG